MKRLSPNFDMKLTSCPQFKTIIKKAVLEEETISYLEVRDQDLSQVDLSNLTLQHLRFIHCNFSHANFQKASLSNVVFETCDLSNSIWAHSYLNRMEMKECKGLGVLMNECICNHTMFKNCVFNYANFSFSQFTSVLFEQTDLKDSEMEECTYKNVEFTDSNLTGMNFFKTSLRGIDFTTDQIGHWMISNEPIELRGAIFSASQALELVTILHVIIK